MWRKWKVWIPKEPKNTEKYHISHTWGKNGERKDLCVSESNKDKKNSSSKPLLRKQIWILPRVLLIKFQHQQAMNKEYTPQYNSDVVSHLAEHFKITHVSIHAQRQAFHLSLSLSIPLHLSLKTSGV